MVKHRTRRWATITAKHDDTVTVMMTITDPLEECVPKNVVTKQILPLIKKEEREAIRSGI
jgi:hypothetical protein